MADLILLEEVEIKIAAQGSSNEHAQRFRLTEDNCLRTFLVGYGT